MQSGESLKVVAGVYTVSNTVTENALQMLGLGRWKSNTDRIKA